MRLGVAANRSQREVVRVSPIESAISGAHIVPVLVDGAPRPRAPRVA